jgi:hypothetical protein
MTTGWRNWLALSLACLAVGWLFIAAGGLDVLPKPSAPTPAPIHLVRGNFGKYLYGISDLSSRNMKRVEFDPSLPADDTLVVDTLKAVAKDGYGLTVDDGTAPVVETINEVNFVTFTVGQTKVLFELFRNSSGGIGMADFSKQLLP